MEITFDREALLSELRLATKVTGKKVGIPVLAYVRLSVNENGGLTVASTDLELSLRSTLQVKTKGAGSVLVDAARLLGIVSSLSGEISLLAGAEQIEVWSGPSRFKLPTLAVEDFPELPKVSGKHDVEIGAEDALRLIERTGFAAADDDDLRCTGHGLVECKDGLLRLTATDGHRLSHAFVPASGKIHAMLSKRLLSVLPSMTLKDWPLRLHVTDNHVAVSVGPRVVTAKVPEGTFPNYQKVLAAKGDKTARVPRDGLLGSLRRVLAIMSGDRSRIATLTFGPETLGLKARSIHGDGTSEDSLPVSGLTDELVISFSADYLVDFLDRSEAESVDVSLVDGEAAVFLSETGKDDWTYVVMPVRV